MRRDVVMLTVLFLGFACTEDASSPQRKTAPTSTSVGTPVGGSVLRSIDSAGGEIQSADGRLQVIVPESAVQGEVEFTVQPISNHAHGGVGQAYRLGPAGQRFDRPIHLTFTYDTADLVGTAPEVLLIATQDVDGNWLAFREATLDTSTGTLTVATQHFSDFSLLAGAQLRPPTQKVKVGAAASLRVAYCERQTRDDVSELVATCEPARDDDVMLTVSEWAVNGAPGGDGTHGTITGQGQFSALYVAPPEVPPANPVAVSAKMDAELTKVLLVAEIEVEEEEDEHPPLLACQMRCNPEAQPGPSRGSCEATWGGSPGCTEYTGPTDTIDGLSPKDFCEKNGNGEFRPHSCEGEDYIIPGTACLTCCGRQRENITHLIENAMAIHLKGLEGAIQWWKEDCVKRGGVVVDR